MKRGGLSIGQLHLVKSAYMYKEPAYKELPVIKKLIVSPFVPKN